MNRAVGLGDRETRRRGSDALDGDRDPLGGRRHRSAG
jgi:hypothetical protein